MRIAKYEMHIGLFFLDFCSQTIRTIYLYSDSIFCWNCNIHIIIIPFTHMDCHFVILYTPNYDYNCNSHKLINAIIKCFVVDLLNNKRRKSNSVHIHASIAWTELPNKHCIGKHITSFIWIIPCFLVLLVFVFRFSKLQTSSIHKNLKTGFKVSSFFVRSTNAVTMKE